MSDKMGIIISVENYQKKGSGPNSDLNSVAYATNDSDAIQQVFIEKFGIDEIHIFKNEQFTKSTAEHEIQYYLRQMSPETELYIYYAGHGFFSDGKNYLTLYDTSKLNLVKTSISFEDLFLNTFRSIGAKSFVAFIDACAEGIPNNQRGINFRGIDFKTIPLNSRDAFRYALYFSCSPNEKSISDDKLEHGVWTYFLIHAFNDIEAFDTGNYISTASLQKYLMKKVGEFTKGLNKQTPYSVISSSESWILYNSENEKSFEEKIEFMEDEFFNKAYLLNIIKGGYEEDEVWGNYPFSEDLCWGISDTLPDDWPDTLTELMYHANRVRAGQKTMISYEEQIEVEKRIMDFINSIDTSEVE